MTPVIPNSNSLFRCRNAAHVSFKGATDESSNVPLLMTAWQQYKNPEEKLFATVASQGALRHHHRRHIDPHKSKVSVEQ